MTQKPQAAQAATQIPWKRFGEVYYDPSRNVRDHYVDPKSAEAVALIESFEVDGWDGRDPQFWGTASPITPEEAKKCLTERADRWRRLQDEVKRAGTNSEFGRKLVVFETLYCQADKNGKLSLVEPKELGATGNQRAYLFELAMERRLEGGQVGKTDFIIGETNDGVTVDRKIQTDIPVMTVYFKDEQDRLRFMIRENQKKTAGFTEMSTADNLHVIAVLVRKFGATQAIVRKEYEDSAGQKYFCYVQIDGTFPQQEFIVRATPKDKDVREALEKLGRYIAFTKVKGAALPALLAESRQDTLDSWNRKAEETAKKKGESPKYLGIPTVEQQADGIELTVYRPKSAEQVNDQMLAWTRGEVDANAVKMVKKPVIEGWKNTATNEHQKLIARAIHDGDPSLLRFIAPVEIGTNALFHMANTPGVENLNKLLLNVEEIALSKERTDFVDVTKSLLDYAVKLKLAPAPQPVAVVAEPESKKPVQQAPTGKGKKAHSA